MKKIVSMVLVSILCVSLFASCGDESPATTREMPKITSDGRFDVSVEEFKKQFNAVKVSEIEPLEASQIDPKRANEYHVVNCFTVQENFEVAVVSRPDGNTFSEVHVILLNKDERNNEEFKTFKKYIECLIRWANPEATSKDIKTYFEKLNIDNKNSNGALYKDPTTGFSYYYSVVDKDLGFAIKPKD